MCDQCGPAWNRMISASKLEILNEFKGIAGNYIKTFLINSDTNFNGWMATKLANSKNAKDFLGLPLILWWNKERKVWDHPEYNSKEEALEKQEEFRVGTIMEVGFDERTGNWWMIALIHDDDVWKKIQSGELKYTSPSVWPKKIVEGMSNPLITTDYYAIHNAIVSEPAFGIGVANVKGFCEGDEKKCLAELGPMVASIDNSIDHVRVMPFLKKQNSSQITKHGSSELNMEDSEKEKLEKQITALKAEIAEEKKKQTSANNETETETKLKEAQKGNAETEEKKKQESANEETEEQKKDKQQSAAVIDLARKTIHDKILSASKASGANDSTLKEQEAYMLKASLTELQNYETMISPFIQTPVIPQESGLWPNIDSIGSLDASVDDLSDNELLERI